MAAAYLSSPPLALAANDGDRAENSFPALTAWTISATSRDVANNTLPTLTAWPLEADTGAGGINTLPTLTAWPLEANTGAGVVATVLSPATWALDAVGVGYGASANTLPIFSMLASGLHGTVSAGSGTIPALVLDAYAGSYALLEIPVTLEASGFAGNVATATIQTPALTLAIAAPQEGIGSANLTALRITLTASGLAENDGSVSEVLRPVRLVSSGVVGYAGEVSIELSGIVLSATAYANNTATADNDTPTWYIDAEAFSAVAEAYRAWALNVRNAALTEYSGMAFNSFGVFQGRVLAAGATGLHVVGEAELDNATNIAALVRTATTDFGTSYNKRVPRAYVGMKATQDMEFRTITSHDGARAYLIPRNGNSEIQQRRAPIGRGPKARFWQFELANRDGGDFTAVDILVYPEVSNRRVV